MQKILPIILTIIFYGCYAQEPLDIALQNKSHLVNEDIKEFDLKTDKWNLNNYLYTLTEQKIQIDSLSFKSLIDKAKNTKLGKWKTDNFENVYLVKEDEKISEKEIISNLSLSPKEMKEIKKQIKIFNNKGTHWRDIPISVTYPIYSDNKRYCIIGFKFGNSGGYTELYENYNTGWKKIATFNRFSY